MTHPEQGPDGAELPRVAILLATHQGERFLAEQLDSILSQSGADLTVVVSDDNSRDRTRDITRDYAARDPRIEILPHGLFGAAGPNFYRLLGELDVDAYDYVGFADQDDLWMPDKLARHVALLQERRADGVSSNVTAFAEDGTRVLIRKDYPQRLADHLFETPGPGSTYLMTRRLARLVQEELHNPLSPARTASAHDWLVYALARAAGLEWVIDPTSTVDYRQHDANAVGANSGLAPALKRVRLSASRWHREQVRITVESCLLVASPEQLPRLQWFHEILAAPGTWNLLRLARRAPQLRRRPRDRMIMAGLILSGLW